MSFRVIFDLTAFCDIDRLTVTYRLTLRIPIPSFGVIGVMILV